jgi:tyrocidine synthetase-3
MKEILILSRSKNMTTTFKRKISDKLIVIANQKLKERDYWLKKLSGQLEKCYMPYDRLPAGRHDSDTLHDKFGHEYQQVHFDIEGELRERLLKLSNNADFRLHMIFAAALFILLRKYTGSTDIILGSPIYKQDTDIEFINTILPLRNQINNHMTFKELLLQVRQVIMEATENQNYPMEVLLEQLNLSSPPDQEEDFPLFDVTILIENIHDKKYLHIRTNLIFSFLKKEHSIRGLVEYDPLRYKNSRIKRMVCHYENLLKKVIFNVNLSINNIDLLLEAEKKQLLIDFNRVEKKSQPDPHMLQAVTIHEIFENQVEKTPNNVAVLFENYNITYRMLNHRANQAASALRAKGIKPDSIVAVMVEPSIEMAVGILAVLKAGGAYLPIDLDYPASRIKYMLKDSGANVLLTTQNSDNTGLGLVKKQIHLDNKELHQGNIQNIPNINQPGNIAYIIYTSGTTGKPKGVMVEHRNVIAYLLAFYNEFQILAKDIIIQNASYCFDVFVEEFYPVLFKGGKIAITSVSESMDILLLYDNIIKNCVTIVDCTPLLLNELNRFDHFGGIRYFISGGDVLKAEYVENLMKFGCTYNTYGPTETTVCTSYFKCPPAVEANIPIGKPILNYKIYIQDKNNRPVPIGIPGEICVSGKGVSRGYLNKQGLTNEKFIKDPLEKNGRIYKTGDLGAWLKNGNIEFLGRLDQQANIRGYRIELGEIESKLLKHKEIKEAAVVDRANQDGEKELYAYFVSRQEINLLDLRQFLVSELPSYMMPSFFIPIECIPLTTNGKLDRQALPELVIKTRKEYVTPRNRTEKVLTDIWSEVLKVDKNVVGIDTNFFELGGHSLKAIILTSRIQKELNVKVPLAEVFNLQTIREISAYIEIAVKNQYISINLVEKKEYYPLSSAQKRLYILQQMELESTAYNMPQTISLGEEYDINKLKQTIIRLIQRHECLRTSFHMVQDEPVQKIHPIEELEFQIRLYHSYTGRQRVQPFDLAKAPLLRVGLAPREDNRYHLMLDMHHIIYDGVSHQILEQDFMALFEGKELPPLRIQYKDFSQWQNREKHRQILKKQETYWLKEFSGEIPILHLPTDYPRPAIQSYEGKRVRFKILADETRTLKAIALKENVTLYIVLLAVFNILLSKLGSQEEIIIGTPIAGRQHADLQKIIGMFVNTLALRNYPKGKKTFVEFLQEVKVRTLEAFENQEYPFEDLVEKVSAARDVSRNPLFDVMFALQSLDTDAGTRNGARPDTPRETREAEKNGTETKKEKPNVTQQDRDKNIRAISKFDLTLNCVDAGENLLFIAEYCTKLFKNETIERFIAYFQTIISLIVKRPSLELRQIEIISEAEKKQVLHDFNDTEAEYPKDKTLHQLFDLQAVRTPDKVALIYNHRQLTYHELNKKSHRLACVLKEKGVHPGDFVGILLNRSLDMMVSILAVLKSGGAYVPMDPQYPADRVKYILNDSHAGLLLCRGDLSRQLEFAGEVLLLDDIDIKDDEYEYEYEYEYKNKTDANVVMGHVSGPRDPAYIIYTSGSTGRPRGVMIRHSSVVNLVFCQKRYFQIQEAERILQFSSISFDASVEQIFISLFSGAALVLVDKEDLLDGERFESVVSNYCITHIHAVPSFINALHMESPYQVKRMVAGGDICPVSLARKWNQVCDFYNEYGPTETTVTSIEMQVENISDSMAQVPIGKPVDNTKIYILDCWERPVPPGVEGQLYIGGDGVAMGYLNHVELTAEKFIELEVKVKVEEDIYHNHKSYTYYTSYIIYKTGDLARWLSDGNIEFLGRLDCQVKIRGYRIELGEIESELLKLKEVREALVIARAGRGEDRYLVAYIVSTIELEELNLKEYLTGKLPDYMIPSYFISLEAIPLTPSGKVDRKALPDTKIKAGENFTAPRNEMELKLAEIWAEVLIIDGEIGIDDNFFELGGHSLKATILISIIHSKMNVRVPLVELFKNPTIRELARYIKGADQDRYLAIEPVEEREYYPLSSAQKRLYILQQMELKSTAYNMPLLLPLGKDIEINRLETALEKLVTCHESLRTSFQTIDDIPVQRIHEAQAIDFSCDYFESDETGVQELVKNYIKPFDLSHAPLIRSGLIKLPDGIHIWMVDVHHIVSDGTSHTILTEDVLALYNGKELKQLKLQYKDFSQWQNHLFACGEIKAQEDYWLVLYADSREIPRLNYLSDYKRPKVFTFAGDRYGFTLEKEAALHFKSIGSQHGATLFMNILAVLNTLFYKYTGQTDIIIGSGIAGRPHVNLQAIVGMFVNTLAIRNQPLGEKTYQFFLKEVINNCVNAFENQDVQLEELLEKLDIERDPSRNPLFDISMVVQNFRRVGESEPAQEGFQQVETLPLAPENRQNLRYRNTTSKFDMTFFVFEREDDISISIEYYTGIFKKETLQRLAAHLKNVVKVISSTPSIKLKDIDILSIKEKDQVLYEFNATDMEYPSGQTIPGLLGNQVKQTPDSIAVVGLEQENGEHPIQITFGELDKISNQLARYLYEVKGIKPEDRVGIWMSRSLYLPIAVLGIIKAGAAYIPIDPTLPNERIKFILNDSSIGIVISEKRYIRDLNCLQWECGCFHSYLCIDSHHVYLEEEVEQNELMNHELWRHVGETSVDDITGGGWLSSYTGEPISQAEMDEYGDNILWKLEPLLNKDMRVLEIGCATGITMYRIAPRVDVYIGTDLSQVIIEKNKQRVKKEGHKNIKLSCLAAHEIEKLLEEEEEKEENFHLIIINSVIQCFHGHNYLKQVIKKAINLLGPRGWLFVGDIMDQEKKDAMVQELSTFKYSNRDKGYQTKTDFSSELFVSRGFWEDLGGEWDVIQDIQFSDKLYTIENELTKFRYDALITINKRIREFCRKKWEKQKYQDDMRILSHTGSQSLHLPVSPQNLAYTIYTSGTTGNPKGVMVNHQSLVNLCKWHNRNYHVTASDHATLYAGIGFDASVWELFPYLITGSCLYMISDSLKLDTEQLNHYFECNDITIGFLPTQFCQQFTRYENRSLRVLLTGGDKLQTVTARSYALYNNYGPTENTVVTTAYLVEKIGDSIPIGKPIDNHCVYILNRKNTQLQPVNVPGELCISGIGLARGYINNPELTAEKFCLRRPGGHTIYRTGDLARWLSDGKRVSHRNR